MRIAILTPYGLENYGNRLQNYALQKVLENYGHQVETLIVEKRAKGKIHELRRNFVVNCGKGFRLVKGVERKQKKAFQNFNQRYIHCRSERYTDNLVPEWVNCEYDAFIVGSDQVWNTFYWGKSDAQYYLLSFAVEQKRIAYAASFGIEEIHKEWKQIFEIELMKFSSISVREKSGADIIKKLCKKDVPVVLDPTLLISREEWSGLECSCKNKKTEKYIVKLFLGKQSQETIRYIDEYARKYSYKIYELQNIEEKEFFSCGPEEFLYFIDHACAVFTDSFHTVVFSIIFHTPFVVFERTHEAGQNIVSRIDNLLQMFGFENRKGQIEYEMVNKCDYNNTDYILEEERGKALNYLINAIKKVEQYNS